MLNPILNADQAAILKEERRTIQELLTLLASWEAEPKALETLKQALEQLDELFMLVIVGEFNAGKSALINALLGERYLTEGVTPTTAQIHILRHGERAEPLVERGILVLHYPADFLREISIVDTPGTNAVLRQHEEISREFVPRSDLILFVTSADRPFSESERGFMSLIHEWGKKVVILINKFDLLENDAERQKVYDFVRENATRLLGREPEIFPVSAKGAMRAKQAGETLPRSFQRLEDFLFETLNEESRIRLKLGNPLGVALKLSQDSLQKATTRLGLLNEDLGTIQQVERQLSTYRSDLDNEFEFHTLKIDNIINEMQRRGDDFFDRTFRVSRIFSLFNTDAIKEQFEREVIGNTPQQVEAQVQEMIDWMVERESKQWRSLARQLSQQHQTEFMQEAANDALSGFEYNRHQLLQSVGRSAADVVARYDSSREAAELGEKVQQSLAMVGIAEVGAIGVGAALTISAHAAMFDATGILAAGVLGVAGLGVIPYRRNEAKKALRTKLEQLRKQLHRVLLDAFNTEADRSAKRLGESISPYSRFVRDEHERLTAIQGELTAIRGQLTELRERLR
ncbi:MAG: dynamin family protein [Anaerolineales bacterium]|nr:dynamin family protein [Anaerolineales bacterium]MCB9127132.1 dynamin family protein [Ardenticatenales bacterium]